MAEDKLTLALILKDEARTIKKVIEAFHLEGKPLYHRLVVGIDNSTTDKTAEIVKEFTDEISWFTWEQDFSKHRNEIIKKVDIGDFVIMPDGHEIMRPNGRIVLQEFLKDAPLEKDGNIFSPYIEIDVDEYDIPDIVFRRPILFRHTGHIWFKRGVHNFLFDEKNHTTIALPQVSFVHNMHHERKQMRSEMRLDMNKKKLEETTKKNPDDRRDNFYLADVYDEAEQFEEALKCFEKTFDLAKDNDNDLAAQTCISYMNTCVKAKQYNRAIDWGYKGIKQKWNRAELYYYLALCHFKMGNYHGSIHWYKVASTMSVPTDTSYFVMAKVYSWYPWDGMGSCYHKLGEFVESKRCFEKVLEWKVNKETGEKCPTIVKNIENLTKAIEEYNYEDQVNDLISGNANLVEKAGEQIIDNMKMQVV